MTNGRFSLYPTLILFLFLGSFQSTLATSPEFARLDSIFKVNSGVYPQEKLEKMVFEMRSLAVEPLEMGKSELHTSTFHLNGNRIGLALITAQKAVDIFDSLDEEELTVLALIQEARIHRKLGEMGKVDEIEARIMPVVESLPDGKAKWLGLRLRSANGIDHGKLDSAHVWIRPAIEVGERLGDSIMIAGARYVDAVAYQLQGKQKRSLQILREIEPHIQATPDYSMQVQFYNFFGMVYMSVQQNENAVACYRKAIAISRDHQLRWHEGTALNSLAIGLKALGDTAGAIEAHEGALDISIEYNQFSNISSICSGLADIYIGLQDWEQAGTYAQKGLRYAREARMARMEAYALMRVAMVDMAQEDYGHALDQLAQADSITRLSGNWARIRDINEMRAEASEQLGEMEAALHFQRLATSAQDSIEYISAKMYADSLQLSQPVIVQADPSTSKDSGLLWALVAFAGIAVGALFFWRFRKSSPPPAPEPAAPETPPAVTAEHITGAIESLKANKDWTQFMLQFDRIYPGLMASMAQRHPDLTPTDVRILALSRLGLSADETGEILGISTESAKKARYRTRKRLGLASDQSLMQYMLQG